MVTYIFVHAEKIVKRFLTLPLSLSPVGFPLELKVSGRPGNEAGSVPGKSETPDDSSTESLELLNSRLEEQTQLYMILKQSKEDTDAKCRRLEQENQALAKTRDEEEKKLKEVAKIVAKWIDQMKTMELKHNDLASTVRLCKKHNEELTSLKLAAIERNNNLYQTAKTDSKEKIEKLTNTFMDLKNECIAREKMIKDHKQNSESAKVKYRAIIANMKRSHKKATQILVDYIQRRKASLSESEAILDTEEEQLIFETPVPDDLVKLEVKYKSLLSQGRKADVKRMFEKSQTELLQETINDLEKKIKKLSTTFDHQAAEVQANAEVQELLTKIKDAETQMKQVEEEMETYKKESQEKLHKEREINKTVRHIP